MRKLINYLNKGEITIRFDLDRSLIGATINYTKIIGVGAYVDTYTGTTKIIRRCVVDELCFFSTDIVCSLMEDLSISVSGNRYLHFS